MLNALRRFGKWFASPFGIYETIIVCLSAVALELVKPTVDPHMFWLLVILTVYSAVTQPILAFIAYESGRHQEKILTHIEKIVEHLDIKDKQ
jgi:hypothetical protein